MLKPFRKHYPVDLIEARGLKVAEQQDRDLVQIQENVGEFLHTLEQIPLLDGTYLEDIVLSAGATTTINHKLGRAPRGYIVCDRSAATDIYRSSWDTKSLVLHSSAAATVKLWVF